MIQNLFNCLVPSLLALAVFNVNAGVVPYQEPTPQEKAVVRFDKNADSYVTEGEVEAELREEAIIKSVDLQKKHYSKSESDAIIQNMEHSLKQSADKIIHSLDTDGDELVEPGEVNRR